MDKKLRFLVLGMIMIVLVSFSVIAACPDPADPSCPPAASAPLTEDKISQMEPKDLMKEPQIDFTNPAHVNGIKKVLETKCSGSSPPAECSAIKQKAYSENIGGFTDQFEKDYGIKLNIGADVPPGKTGGAKFDGKYMRFGNSNPILITENMKGFEISANGKPPNQKLTLKAPACAAGSECKPHPVQLGEGRSMQTIDVSGGGSLEVTSTANGDTNAKLMGGDYEGKFGKVSGASSVTFTLNKKGDIVDFHAEGSDVKYHLIIPVPGGNKGDLIVVRNPTKEGGLPTTTLTITTKGNSVNVKGDNVYVMRKYSTPIDVGGNQVKTAHYTTTGEGSVNMGPDLIETVSTTSSFDFEKDGKKARMTFASTGNVNIKPGSHASLDQGTEMSITVGDEEVLHTEVPQQTDVVFPGSSEHKEAVDAVKSGDEVALSKQRDNFKDKSLIIIGPDEVGLFGEGNIRVGPCEPENPGEGCSDTSSVRIKNNAGDGNAYGINVKTNKGPLDNPPNTRHVSFTYANPPLGRPKGDVSVTQNGVVITAGKTTDPRTMIISDGSGSPTGFKKGNSITVTTDPGNKHNQNNLLALNDNAAYFEYKYGAMRPYIITTKGETEILSTDSAKDKFTLGAALLTLLPPPEGMKAGEYTKQMKIGDVPVTALESKPDKFGARELVFDNPDLVFRYMFDPSAKEGELSEGEEAINANPEIFGLRKPAEGYKYKMTEGSGWLAEINLVDSEGKVVGHVAYKNNEGKIDTARSGFECAANLHGADCTTDFTEEEGSDKTKSFPEAKAPEPAAIDKPAPPTTTPGPSGPPPGKETTISPEDDARAKKVAADISSGKTPSDTDLIFYAQWYERKYGVSLYGYNERDRTKPPQIGPRVRAAAKATSEGRDASSDVENAHLGVARSYGRTTSNIGTVLGSGDHPTYEITGPGGWKQTIIYDRNGNPWRKSGNEWVMLTPVEASYLPPRPTSTGASTSSNNGITSTQKDNEKVMVENKVVSSNRHKSSGNPKPRPTIDKPKKKIVEEKKYKDGKHYKTIIYEIGEDGKKTPIGQKFDGTKPAPDPSTPEGKDYLARGDSAGIKSYDSKGNEIKAPAKPPTVAKAPSKEEKPAAGGSGAGGSGAGVGVGPASGEPKSAEQAMHELAQQGGSGSDDYKKSREEYERQYAARNPKVEKAEPPVETAAPAVKKNTPSAKPPTICCIVRGAKAEGAWYSCPGGGRPC